VLLLTADMFSVWKLTDLEDILLIGIYTKMSEQIDVWCLYSLVLKLAEKRTPGVETCSGLIRIMNCIVGS